MKKLIFKFLKISCLFAVCFALFSCSSPASSSSGNPNSTPGTNSGSNGGMAWQGEGWYALIERPILGSGAYWYIAKFDSSKNLISKNRKNELSYVRGTSTTTNDFPTKFPYRSTTNKTTWETFEDFGYDIFVRVQKLSDEEMENHFSYALWLLNEKKLEADAVYHFNDSERDYYVKFSGTVLEDSSVLPMGKVKNDVNAEFAFHNFTYNSTLDYILTSGKYQNFRKASDSELPPEVYRHYKGTYDPNAYYKFSYTEKGKKLTGYARWEAENEGLRISFDGEVIDSFYWGNVYSEFSYRKDFQTVEYDSLPVNIQNIFIKHEHLSTDFKYYTWSSGTKKFYAIPEKADSRSAGYSPKLKIAFSYDTTTSEYKIESHTYWHQFAANSTEKITQVDLATADETIKKIDNGPDINALYSFVDENGDTFYVNFYDITSYRYYINSYKNRVGVSKDTGSCYNIESTSSNTKDTDWATFCLNKSGKTVNESEYSSLPKAVKYYYKVGVSVDKNTVFKVFVDGSTTYYSVNPSGMFDSSSSTYAKSDDGGTTFYRISWTKLAEKSIPTKYNEMVFLSDFEQTDISAETIKNATWEGW